MFVRNGKAAGSIRYEGLVEHEHEEVLVTSEPIVPVEPEPVDERTDTERYADEAAAAAREELGLDEPSYAEEDLPGMEWTRDALDRYALARGRDTTDLPNKQAVLDAINN